MLKFGKCLGLFVLCAMAVAVAWLLVNWGSPEEISVQAIRPETNLTRKTEIWYKITNGTSRPMELYLSRVEALHEKTGWWKIDTASTWHLEQSAGHILGSGAGAHLNPRSMAELEIRPAVPPLRYRGDSPAVEGLALQGELLYFKAESPSLKRARAVGRSLGLPRRWLMSRVQGHPLALPAVDLGAITMTAKPASPPGDASPVKTAPLTASSESSFSAGSIKFRQAELKTVLDIFADLAGAQLEIEPRVRTLTARIDFENSIPLTRSEAIRLLGKSLQEQAGIVVKHLDNTHISITSDQ